MKQSIRHILLVGASVLLASSMAPLSAASPIVETAKDNCVVGEQADGYLGVVTGKQANDVLRREIRDVNQQRKTVYAQLAKRNGVTIEVAAALTAEKLMNQASRGQCIRNQAGSWVEI